ncbi:MAG TPA: alpha/beta hydrolase [Candidatus Limnocylindrales bacterium]|nr:alpha/beta hydrolase [Candidatus Limnocylindrales bacterium]
MQHELFDIGGAPLLDVAGTSLFVRRWGKPDGRPLLFLHSLGPAASAELLAPGVAPLADAGWSVAAPDMPGFGESPPIEVDGYRAERLADLAWSIADGLGWDRLALAGHSWGGSVAVHAAAARPERVRALVLVDSGHIDYADQPGPRLDETLDELTDKMEAARVRPKDRAEVASDLGLPIDDPVVDAYMAGLIEDGAGGLVSRTTGASRAKAMYHLMRARQSDQWAALAAAEFPILLLLATKPDDLRTTNAAAAARFGAAVPRADIRFVEGATHSLITDLRDEFGATVRDWLSSLTRRD